MRKLYQVELCGISISIDSPVGELKIHLTLTAHVIYDKECYRRLGKERFFNICYRENWMQMLRILQQTSPHAKISGSLA